MLYFIAYSKIQLLFSDQKGFGEIIYCRVEETLRKDIDTDNICMYNSQLVKLSKYEKAEGHNMWKLVQKKRSTWEVKMKTQN